MLGSSQSIAGPNIALNTIMAEELSIFADELEKAEDLDSTLQKLISKALDAHRRIIFDGNGYSDEWKEEAGRRGLSNLPSTADSLPAYISRKNIDLVVRHGIFTENEFHARYAIHLEAYNKMVNIEARTMEDMVLHQILPAAMRYTRDLCDGVAAKRAIGAGCRAENSLIQRLSKASDDLYENVMNLSGLLKRIPKDAAEASLYYHDIVSPCMIVIRRDADVLEKLTDKSYWPYPTYSDLLFY